MTNFIRRLIIIAMGLAGGLFVWPLVELLLGAQELFPSYFLYSATIGALVGVVLGAFFAAAGGLCDRSVTKALDGAWKGALVGIAGGLLSALAAQAFLFFVGERLLKGALLSDSEGSPVTVGFILARAAAWLVVGAAIGSAEGLRSRSARKISMGLLGGIAGGFLGGLLFTILSIRAPSFGAGRLLSLMLMGSLISLFYALLEKRFATGSLKALNGPLKGKDFLICQRRLRLGQDKNCDIVIEGYREVEALHAELLARRGELEIERKAKSLRVNDKEVSKQVLKLDDVIQLGSAKFLYGYFG